MYSYVARQPIFDTNLEIFGYELLYRDGPDNAFPSRTTSGITEKMFVEQHLTYQNILLDKKLGFINFDYDDLINDLPLDFPNKDYVIEILETCEPDKYLFNSLIHLKNNGYTIALDDFCIKDIRWNAFIELADIIKIDIQEYPLNKVKHLVSELKKHNKKLLAEKVETHDEYNEAKLLGFEFFQGYFLSKPEIIIKKKMDEVFIANVELLKEVGKDRFSVDTIEKIVSKSTTLTLRLLNYVNSQVTVRSKISSLSQAISYLGRIRLKRFSSHLLLSSSSIKKPDVVFQTSLCRAYLLKSLAKKLYGQNISDKAFITGMISMVDVILDMDIIDVISGLNLDEQITAAILRHQGELGELLLLVKSLERGDWESIGRFQSKHGNISPSISCQYIDTIDYINRNFE